ncbi:hypothetical protein JR316_0000574 [Psilocybe cubensis]|uniref:Uncharacterized protein n=2 Tax=Psilocybe cubensis TaxID=181762 RepID=A0ACB8HFN5_PSICU|nr:hypothetical protein JR316_0000574 [Psilocybe cubensis]KAH9486509.1 hypothetical protein JR316_0000574 [Psilocybe cubensis]
MNVARGALIRSAGIRRFIRAPLLHNSLSRPSSTSSNSTDHDSSIHANVSAPLVDHGGTHGLVTPLPQDSTGNDDQNDPSLKAMKSATYYHLERLAAQHGLELTAKHYGAVMKNCIRYNVPTEAFKTYNMALKAGIIPTARLVTPLLTYLGQVATYDAICKALKLYREISTAHPNSSLEDGTAGPNIHTYNRMIKMLLSSPREDRHTPLITSLVEDMEMRGIPTNSSFVAAAKIIVAMRQKRRFEDVLPVYRKERTFLDQTGFFDVLEEYCNISFVGNLDTPLITHYFSIVNDMRLQRVVITPQVYGLIVKHINTMVGKLAESGDRKQAAEAIPRLIATIRRVHDFLTLDASFSPTPILLNQLLDAYQRLGCFGDAYRLWDMMYMSGIYDQITVTIMLDACGYAHRLDKAREILRKVTRTGFKLDLQNWNTWIECLCRGGQFTLAQSVAFSEMSKHGVQPDIVTFTLLAKFAKKLNFSLDWLRRVESDYPQVYVELPEEIRNL